MLNRKVRSKQMLFKKIFATIAILFLVAQSMNQFRSTGSGLLIILNSILVLAILFENKINIKIISLVAFFELISFLVILLKYENIHAQLGLMISCVELAILYGKENKNRV